MPFGIFRVEDIVNYLLININNLHKNIRFHFNIESNSSLNFLDINIIKTNNKLRFKIYKNKNIIMLNALNNCYKPEIFDNIAKKVKQKKTKNPSIPIII